MNDPEAGTQAKDFHQEAEEIYLHLHKLYLHHRGSRLLSIDKLFQNQYLCGHSSCILHLLQMENIMPWYHRAFCRDMQHFPDLQFLMDEEKLFVPDSKHMG